MQNKKDKSVIDAYGWIQTYSGNKFHILRPVLDEICIKDIAHSQSLLCRFGGHCPFFYSVGAHALIGSYLIKPEYALDFLLHDSTESFIGDMVSPLKREMKKFQKVEAKLFKVIAEKYHLHSPMPPEVKEMDKFMFHTEWNYLMGGKYQDKNPLISKKVFMKLATYSPKKLEKLFLNRFNELSR